MSGNRFALLPIAAGHIVSVGLVAGAAVAGFPIDRPGLAIAAGAVLVVAFCLRKRRLGLALWSFLVATAHGSGLMLVPALAPLCVTGASTGAITAYGPVGVGVAAAVLHAAAMMLVTGTIAAGVVNVVAGRERWTRRLASGSPWGTTLRQNTDLNPRWAMNGSKSRSL